MPEESGIHAITDVEVSSEIIGKDCDMQVSPVFVAMIGLVMPRQCSESDDEFVEQREVVDTTLADFSATRS